MGNDNATCMHEVVIVIALLLDSSAGGEVWSET